MSDICNVDELDSDCAESPGPGPQGAGETSWVEFLRLTCRHCELAATCSPAQELLDFVKRAWRHLQSCKKLTCWPGLQAVSTVHKQFFVAGVIQEEHLLPDCLPSWQTERERDALSPLARQRIRFWRPLFPFPLLASQQLLYSQLDPAGPESLCSLPDGGMYISRRFMPRADLSASSCAVRRTDMQLLTACRNRRDRGGDLFRRVLSPVHANQLRLGSFAAAEWSRKREEVQRADRKLAGGKCLNHINETCVSPDSSGFDLRRPFLPPSQVRNSDLISRRERFYSLQCPALVDDGNESVWWGWADDSVGRDRDDDDMKKYKTRSSDGGCQSQTGAWGADLQDALKCVLVVVAERFGFQPGELLLDWGSGCGFTMSWAKAFYDVDALGLEVTPAASWAARYSLGLSCLADGRKLQWIPDGLFDYVFSYAALLHLNFEEQCEVAHQLLQKLRLGGKAFLGWNRANRVGPWEWYDCFWSEMGSSVELEVLEEATLFSEDPSVITEQHRFAWDFPSYAVLLKRAS